MRFRGLFATALAVLVLGTTLDVATDPRATGPVLPVAAFADSVATEPALVPVVATTTVVPTTSIRMYKGLGTWVDIYDEDVFDHPERAVSNMAAQGVHTLYVETGNSYQSSAIKRPTQMRRLIQAAHARGIKIVAWYLPNLKDPALDYARCKAAILLRTSDGQRFDSFALDIESSVVKPVSERNRRLLRLSAGLRNLVGSGYPLGAIIPSPWGMQKNGYWQPFPYQALADTYDVFLPMSYFTYHGDGEQAAYDDTLANMTVLRAQPGCANEPVHLIGGISTRASGAETRAFVRGARETACVGISLYDYPTTRAWHWSALETWIP